MVSWIHVWVIVPVGVKQTTEGIFQGSGCYGITVGFNRWKVDDVLAHKETRDKDAVREYMVKNGHFCLGFVFYPTRIFRLEVVFLGGRISPERVQICYTYLQGRRLLLRFCCAR